MNENAVIGLIAEAGRGLPSPAPPTDAIVRRARRRARTAGAFAATGAAAACAVLITLAAVLVPGADELDGAPGPARGGGPAVTGTAPWERALLLPGDPSVVTVRFTAGPDGSADDACAERFRLDANESRDKVELTLRRLPPVPSATSDPRGCALGGTVRYMTADLDRAVGDRRLVDGSVGEQRVLDDVSGDRSRAAIRPATGASPTGETVAGRLAGDPSTGCLWVESDGGREPVLIVGAQHSVRFSGEQAVLYDEDNPDPYAAGQLRLEGSRGGAADAVPGCPVAGPPVIASVRR